MNLYAVLYGSALLGYLFILGLLYGRARRDPVNAAFRVFLLAALGWATTGFISVLPVSGGHEVLLKRIAAVCWISINFWFVRFVYLLLKRRRDTIYWTLAATAAGGTVVYLFTDLAIEGFSRHAWGIAALRGPLHSAIACIPAVTGGYALLTLARAIPATPRPAARKSITLLIIGAGAALAFSLATDAIIPIVPGWAGFPEVGSVGVFLLCPFLYLAVTRHDFLSVSIAQATERLFDDLHDGVVLLDPSGRITRSNSAARRILGMTGEAEGKRLSDYLSEGDGDSSNGTTTIQLGQGGNARYVTVARSRNTHGGHDLGEVVLLRDITEEKRTAELLRASRDELQAEVVRRTEELRHAQKMEAIGTLAGGIAHDFNNILAAIVGFATAANEDLPDGSPLHNDLEEVLRAAGRAREIVRQLLLFARRKEPQKKNVNLSAVVAETISLLQASLPSTIHIDFVPARKPCVVFADPTQLQQIVMNLATNAYQAMQDRGGVLRISVGRLPIDAVFAESNAPLKPGPHVCLTVSDSGCGMAPDVLARIFDPFFTTKSADQGTGLGLATALRIAREHAGTITVESEPSVGSTFRVYLPVAEYDLLSDSTRDKKTPGGTESILIVDDKEPVAASTARLLQPLGYKITKFTDPDLALAAIADNPKRFDLVITDQTMPRVTGTVLAERVGRIRADLPVLLVSGYPPPGGMTSGITAPGRAFLPKPLEKASLARTIRKLLDPPDEAPAARRADASTPTPPPSRPN